MLSNREPDGTVAFLSTANQELISLKDTPGSVKLVYDILTEDYKVDLCQLDPLLRPNNLAKLGNSDVTISVASFEAELLSAKASKEVRDGIVTDFSLFVGRRQVSGEVLLRKLPTSKVVDCMPTAITMAHSESTKKPENPKYVSHELRDFITLADLEPGTFILSTKLVSVYSSGKLLSLDVAVWTIQDCSFQINQVSG